jgi:hypothetical protein
MRSYWELYGNTLGTKKSNPPPEEKKTPDQLVEELFIGPPRF